MIRGLVSGGLQLSSPEEDGRDDSEYSYSYPGYSLRYVGGLLSGLSGWRCCTCAIAGLKGQVMSLVKSGREEQLRRLQAWHMS